jgi:hypothetical protein
VTGGRFEGRHECLDIRVAVSAEQVERRLVFGSSAPLLGNVFTRETKINPAACRRWYLVTRLLSKRTRVWMMARCSTNNCVNGVAYYRPVRNGWYWLMICVEVRWINLTNRMSNFTDIGSYARAATLLGLVR